MTIRIIKPEDVLIACIQAPLSDADLLDLKETLVERVTVLNVRGVIVDVTGLDVVDFFTSRTLRDLAEANRTRGTRTVVVGVDSDVAFAMGKLGVSLGNVPMASDLREGLTYLGSLRDQDD